MTDEEMIENLQCVVNDNFGTIQQLYNGEEVEQIVKERNIYKRALQIAEELGELCAPASNYIQQAEKELQEERKDD